MDAPMRLRVRFAGHVQGVGFRYTAMNVARGFDVAGYVRNLPDGGVELVAEGPPGEVRRFVEAVMEEMSGYIRDTQTNEEPANGEFNGFDVRY